MILFEELYIKLESDNLSGSIKDRIVRNILLDYKKKNELKKEVVTASSGNTGIALSLLQNEFDIKATIFIPKNTLRKINDLIKFFDANVIVVDGDIEDAIIEAKKYAEKNDALYFEQYNNEQNYKTHFDTYYEIIEALPNVEYVITAISTGGTAMGIAKMAKLNNQNIKVIGVRPDEVSEIPGTTKKNLSSFFDEGLIETHYVNDVEVKKLEKEIIKKGLFVGPSTVASILVAKKIKDASKDAVIAVISADNGMKYLSDEYN